jgi:hypothetical protein
VEEGKSRCSYSLAVDGSPWISLSDPRGGIAGERIVLGISQTGPQFIFKDSNQVDLGFFAGALGKSDAASIDLYGSPSIKVNDKDGYSTTIGSAGLITERAGESH